MDVAWWLPILLIAPAAAAIWWLSRRRARAPRAVPTLVVWQRVVRARGAAPGAAARPLGADGALAILAAAALLAGASGLALSLSRPRAPRLVVVRDRSPSIDAAASGGPSEAAIDAALGEAFPSGGFREVIVSVASREGEPCPLAEAAGAALAAGAERVLILTDRAARSPSPAVTVAARRTGPNRGLIRLGARAADGQPARANVEVWSASAERVRVTARGAQGRVQAVSVPLAVDPGGGVRGRARLDVAGLARPIEVAVEGDGFDDRFAADDRALLTEAAAAPRVRVAPEVPAFLRIALEAAGASVTAAGAGPARPSAREPAIEVRMGAPPDDRPAIAWSAAEGAPLARPEAVVRAPGSPLALADPRGLTLSREPAPLPPGFTPVWLSTEGRAVVGWRRRAPHALFVAAPLDRESAAAWRAHPATPALVAEALTAMRPPERAVAGLLAPLETREAAGPGASDLPEPVAAVRELGRALASRAVESSAAPLGGAFLVLALAALLAWFGRGRGRGARRLESGQRQD